MAKQILRQGIFVGVIVSLRGIEQLEDNKIQTIRKELENNPATDTNYALEDGKA